jgi:hypothetical protein
MSALMVVPTRPAVVEAQNLMPAGFAQAMAVPAGLISYYIRLPSAIRQA